MKDPQKHAAKHSRKPPQKSVPIADSKKVHPLCFILGNAMQCARDRYCLTACAHASS